MKKRFWFAVIAASMVGSLVFAQQFPMLDAVANKVAQKYQSSSCEQLWEKKGSRNRPRSSASSGC